MTEGALRTQVAGNSHAPDACRADTVRNLDAWYDAFDVRPGERLYLEPSARVRNLAGASASDDLRNPAGDAPARCGPCAVAGVSECRNRELVPGGLPSRSSRVDRDIPPSPRSGFGGTAFA